jgi:hypothetical protein
MSLMPYLMLSYPIPIAIDEEVHAEQAGMLRPRILNIAAILAATVWLINCKKLIEF